MHFMCLNSWHVTSHTVPLYLFFSRQKKQPQIPRSVTTEHS